MDDALASYARLSSVVTAAGAVLVLCAILIQSVRVRQWPRLQEVVPAMVGAAGICSGIKVAASSLLLSDASLGLLANDRLALVVGGAALTLLGARAVWDRSRSAVGT